MKTLPLLALLLLTMAGAVHAATPGQAASILVVAGDGEREVSSSTDSHAYFPALAFLVRDTSGAPVANAAVLVDCHLSLSPVCYLDPDKDTEKTLTTDAHGFAVLATVFCRPAPCVYHGVEAIGANGTVHLAVSMRDNPAVATTATLNVVPTRKRLVPWLGNAQKVPNLDSEVPAWLFGLPPAVEALDDDGAPRVGAPVTFTCVPALDCILAATNDGYVNVATATTDANGIATIPPLSASVNWFAPLGVPTYFAVCLQPGNYTITAALDGQTVTFNEVAVALASSRNKVGNSCNSVWRALRR